MNDLLKSELLAKWVVDALTVYVDNVLDKIHVSDNNLDKHIRFRNMFVYIINELTEIYKLER